MNVDTCTISSINPAFLFAFIVLMAILFVDSIFFRRVADNLKHLLTIICQRHQIPLRSSSHVDPAFPGQLLKKRIQ